MKKCIISSEVSLSVMSYSSLTETNSLEIILLTSEKWKMQHLQKSNYFWFHKITSRTFYRILSNISYGILSKYLKMKTSNWQTVIKSLTTSQAIYYSVVSRLYKFIISVKYNLKNIHQGEAISELAVILSIL